MRGAVCRMAAFAHMSYPCTWGAKAIRGAPASLRRVAIVQLNASVPVSSPLFLPQQSCGQGSGPQRPVRHAAEDDFDKEALRGGSTTKETSPIDFCFRLVAREIVYRRVAGRGESPKPRPCRREPSPLKQMELGRVEVQFLALKVNSLRFLCNRLGHPKIHHPPFA